MRLFFTFLERCNVRNDIVMNHESRLYLSTTFNPNHISGQSPLIIIDKSFSSNDSRFREDSMLESTFCVKFTNLMSSRWNKGANALVQLFLLLHQFSRVNHFSPFSACEWCIQSVDRVECLK